MNKLRPKKHKYSVLAESKEEKKLIGRGKKIDNHKKDESKEEKKKKSIDDEKKIYTGNKQRKEESKKEKKQTSGKSKDTSEPKNKGASKKKRGPRKSRVTDAFDKNNLMVVKHPLCSFFAFKNEDKSEDEKAIKTWSTYLNMLAKAKSILMFYVAILHQMHFQHMCELKEPIGEWGQTTIDHAFMMVGKTYPGKGDPTEESIALHKTFKDHFVPVFGSIECGIPLDGALRKVCCSARVDYLTTLKNNISTNFYKRHTKWVSLQLLRWRIAQYKGNLPKKALNGIGKASYNLAKWMMAPFTYLTKNRITLDTNQQSLLFETLETDGSSSSKSLMVVVMQILQTFANRVPLEDGKAITEDYMQQKWYKFIPWFGVILSEFKNWQEEAKMKHEAKIWDQDERNRACRKVRLFYLAPQTKLGVGHIRIDKDTLVVMGLEMKLWQGSRDPLCADAGINPSKYWTKLFKMSELLKRQVASGKYSPSWAVSTDGVSCSTTFARSVTHFSKPPKPKKKKTSIKKKKPMKPESSITKRKRSSTKEATGGTIQNKRFRQEPEEKKESESKLEEKRESILEEAEIADSWDSSDEREEDEVAASLPVAIHPKSIVVGLDPGMRSIYSAYAVDDSKIHKKTGIRVRLSGVHFRRRAKVPRRTRRAVSKLKQWKEERKLLEVADDPVDDMNSSKLVSLEETKTYWTARQPFLAAQWEFYSDPWHRKEKRDAFMRTQSAYTWACKRLLAPYWSKISKDDRKAGAKVVIAFGMERFQGGKGYPRPGIGKFYRCLTTQFQQKCTVIDTSEYYTSQKCPCCGKFTHATKTSYPKPTGNQRKTKPKRHKPSLKRKKRQCKRFKKREGKRKKKKKKKEKTPEREETKEEKKMCIVNFEETKEEKKKHNKPKATDTRRKWKEIVYGLKACTTCDVVYDRDNMAAQNLQQSLVHIQKTGQRPDYLQRSQTSNVDKARAGKLVYALLPRPQKTIRLNSRTWFFPGTSSSFHKTPKLGGDIRL